MISEAKWISRDVECIEDNAFESSISCVTFEHGSSLKRIGKSAFAFSKLQGIEIPASVEVLDDGCFEFCRGLKFVRFEPHSCLRTINSRAFSVTQIRDITIPAAVQAIHERAFAHTLIDRVVFEEGSNLLCIDKEAFTETRIQRIKIPEKVQLICEKAFQRCENLYMLLFSPKSVLKYIGRSAFEKCKLGDVVIPASVEVIDNSAFLECNKMNISFEPESRLRKIGEKAIMQSFPILHIPRGVESAALCIEPLHRGQIWAREVSFEEGMKRIPELACSKLCAKIVRIPASVEVIDAGAFSEVCAEIEIAPESRIKRINEFAFRVSRMRKLTIPRTVEVIGKQCFELSAISEISFESGSCLRKIKEAAFRHALNLKRIQIPASVEVIGEECFALASSKISISFEPGSRLKRVKAAAFRLCYITEIDLPASLEYIGAKCFADNKQLKRIGLPEDSQLEFIGKDAFKESSLTSIRLPATLTTLSGGVFSGCDVVDLSIDSNNKKFVIDGPVIMTSDRLSIVACFRYISAYQVPRYVETLCAGCFSYRPTLSTLTFERDSALKCIEDGAFCESGIFSMELPKSLEVLGSGSLRNVMFSSLSFEQGTKLKRIEAYAFTTSQIDVLNIPPSVEEIQDGAFAGAMLNSIEGLPDNLIIRDGMIMSKDETRLVSAFKEIKKFVVPLSVEVICEGCFFGKDLQEIHFPSKSKVRIFEKNAFRRTKLQNIKIPASLEVIGAGCFADIRSEHWDMDELTFSCRRRSCLKRIEDEAFMKSHFTDFRIPRSVEVIGKRCFAKSSLRDLKIESGSRLEHIKKEAFMGVVLTSVRIPSSVRVIGTRAFADCYYLREIEFRDDSGLRQVKSEAFARCGATDVTLPPSAEDIGENVFIRVPRRIMDYEDGPRVVRFRERKALMMSLNKH